MKSILLFLKQLIFQLLLFLLQLSQKIKLIMKRWLLALRKLMQEDPSFQIYL